jgi:ligand-binding sensor domain-containing protein
VRARWRRAAGIALALPVAAAAMACAAAAIAPAQIPEPVQPASAGAALWVGTGAGLSRLAATERGTVWTAFAPPRGPLPAGRVLTLAAGTRGDVWVGTARGLVRLGAPGGANVVDDAETFDAGNSALPHPQVMGIAVDGRGTAWAATANGGAAIDPSMPDRTFTTLNAPLLHTILDAAYVDPAGRVWFGGAGGVNVYQPGTGTSGGAGDGIWPVGFTRYSSNGGLPDDLVFAISGDSRGRVWFGTAGGVAAFTPDPAAFALGADTPENWQTFTPANSPLVHGRVHAIVEDRQGRMWLGTDAGISVVPAAARAGDASGWQQFSAGPGRRSGQADHSGQAGQAGDAGSGGLPHPFVQALALGPDGRVWAGTPGGLAVYDPAHPEQGWSAYRASPLKRWAGYLWPPFWRQTLVSNDVTALAWSRI